jgi:cell division protein FtsW
MSVPRPKIPSAVFHTDSALLAACLSILCLGFIMVCSASLHLGVKVADDISHYPFKQLIHIILGLVAAAGVVAVPMSRWESLSRVLLLGGIVLLIVVLIPGIGIRVNGSQRWLSIIGMRIQVSEIVKFATVMYISGYINRYRQHVQQSLFGMLRPLLMMGVACALLLLEPDFGSAVVVLIIAMGILFLGGAQLLPFIIMLGGAIAGGAILATGESYRLKRIVGFLDPWEHAKDSGYQLTQALIAFGRGELRGVGLGNGLQKLFYLPEAHTDFIFSVLGEELGLLGVFSVIGLFAVLIWRAFVIGSSAQEAHQPFSALVAYGLAIWFGFQSFVNMGVNMGLLPTKGLTLPLMSYGGGSMIVMCAALAVLFRIHYENTEWQKANRAPVRRSAR